MSTADAIDFVIPWVDGSDPKWMVEKCLYEDKSVQKAASQQDAANSQCRYRGNNELLKYLFRSVEAFAPWVNKIHFVTCGQKPDWLNENHPKLHLVNHADFIPEKYLPTFNSITIEMNFHRIEGLSERFVFFNDDNYLLQPAKQEFFFRDGNPVLDTNLRYTNVIGYNNWSRLLFNDYCLVNSSFDLNKSIWKHRRKWFNVKELGYKRARRNFVCYLANRTLPVSFYGHLALPHLKTTLEEVWELHGDVMDQTCRNKFRADNQVNQWLLCAWNQAKGCFYPTRADRMGRNVIVNLDYVSWACELIKGQQVPQLCINDSWKNDDSDCCLIELIQAFDSILPSKSQFEKWNV